MNVIQLRTPGGPEVLELVARPLPEPGANEARVRAAAIGVSSADMLIRKGIYNLSGAAEERANIVQQGLKQ